jgi:carbonic anhydrase
MKNKAIPFVLLVFLLTASRLLSAPDAPPQVTPDEALRRLTEGNARFVQGTSTHPDATAARRDETAQLGQHPFVTILSCSDSRVPLELVFDQGIGDIFVVRVAGNVCGPSETGSIEYGVDHVGTPLLVVLGHSQCGAVTAATMSADVHGAIKPLVARIAPAVKEAQAAHPDIHGNDLIPAATETNVWLSIKEILTQSPATRKLVKHGKLKVVGALYDVKSGAVRWLGTHPRQDSLLRDSD